MSSPTEAYLAWYQTLAPELQKELTLALLPLLPGRPLGREASTPGGFEAALERLSDESKGDAGTALTLAALTDYLFFEKTDAQTWEKNGALLDLLSEVSELAGEQAGQIGDFVAGVQLRNPLRARLWKAAAPSWEATRAGPLSLPAIAEWLITHQLPGLRA